MIRGHPLRAELVRCHAPVSADGFPEIDGSSRAIRSLKRDMLCAARDPDVTTLVTGESGTGKERVAHAIHRASPRAGAVDDDKRSAGPFERAEGGTVLLDEIGDLPLDLQMKLLRAVQSRTIQRLGGRQDTPFDVRIIAATNLDLAAAVARGRFREDLYYRLKVYEIGVPPLRDRGADDIRALATAILRRLAERRRRAPPAIDPQVLDCLVGSHWPGNVRELENVLERMLVAAAGEPLLHARHLPRSFRSAGSAPPGRGDRPAVGGIREALERNGFRFGRTAADLGLSRHQLYRLVKRYGIRASAGDP
jgi:Nif-specific regulatory protein